MEFTKVPPANLSAQLKSSWKKKLYRLTVDQWTCALQIKKEGKMNWFFKHEPSGKQFRSLRSAMQYDQGS